MVLTYSDNFKDNKSFFPLRGEGGLVLLFTKKYLSIGCPTKNDSF